MFSKILMVVIVCCAVFAVLVVRQPAEFRIERSAAIAAPQAKVFSEVNNLHAWDSWSPWAKLDPSAKESFGGPAAGTGAAMRWMGNNKVGAGTMTITESRPNSLVQLRLDFQKPMKATNIAEFTFKPQGKQTLVTWSMISFGNMMPSA